jgi:serine/threonine protein kinase
MNSEKFDLAGTKTYYIGQQIGNYRIERLLGKGTFAATYQATHRYLGSQAAIKVLFTRRTNQEIKMFYAEARNLANLMHPHIVHFLEFGIQNNIPFLVMEYATFGTLRQLYPEGQILPLDIVLDYVKQIASGLQYMHDWGYIHQDIKPENLLIGRNNQVLIGDFGITITIQEAQAFDKNKIVGTVPYMAPEQLQGEPCFATDQYSLGVIVYEWLCGTLPFNGSSLEIQRKHLDVDPPSMRVQVPSILPAIDQVVLRALAKEPDQRFSSIRTFAKALERAYQDRSGEYPIPLKYRATKLNHSSLASENPASFPRFQAQVSSKRSPWFEIMALFAVNLLTGAAGGALLYTFNIEAPAIWALLTLYFISFPLAGALALKNRQAFILGSSIIIIGTLFGLVLHSLVLFLGVYVSLLLFGMLLAFNVNLHRL